MITTDEILQNWEKDCILDETKMLQVIIDTSRLHHKYLVPLMKHKNAIKRLELEISEMRKVKFVYYSGKMSEEELEERGWEQFKYTLKSDVKTYVDADPDIIKLMKRKFAHETAFDTCEAIIKALEARGFATQTWVKYEMFMNGAR